MAIKGLSSIRRLPRLGKIRLGEKALSKNGNPYPRAVDYFVCPPEVQAVYGEKPRELDIMFPVEDQNIFFPQWYKRYGSTTGLVCKGDGETAIMWQDGEMIEIECVPDECEWYAKKHCRRLANLQFMLPKVPGLGIWQIDTTSFYSIININSALDMIRAVTGGRVHMIPLKLVLKPQEVQPDGKKKTVYVLDLVAPVTLAKLLANVQKTPQQLLMPALDENERPEDLYPDGVLNRQEPEPFTLDAQPQPQPAPQEPPGPAAHTPAVPAEEMPFEENTIDFDLHAAWDILGTPNAKRKAILAKPNLDKEKLLAQLQAEIDRRNAEEAGRKTSPQNVRQGQLNFNQPPPPPPPQAPPAQVPTGAFF